MRMHRLALVLLPGFLIACPDSGGGGDTAPGLTGADADLASSMSPLPDLPADPTNKYADDANAAALGQQLFFDTAFSGAIAAATDGTPNPLGNTGDKCKVACVDCHGRVNGSIPTDGDNDGRAMDDRHTPAAYGVAMGTNFHPHNAPAVVNAAYYEWVNWGGRFKRIWELPGPVEESPVIMNGTRILTGRVLYAKYKDKYEAIFGTGSLDPRFDAACTDCTGGAISFDAEIKSYATTAAPTGTTGLTGAKPSGLLGCGGGQKVFAADGTTKCSAFDYLPAADQTAINTMFTNYGKVLQAYIRKLVSKDSPWDKYVASGFKSADVSQAAVDGFKAFNKAGCAQCHSGKFFSNAASTEAFGNMTATDDMFRTTGVKQAVKKAGATDTGRGGAGNQPALTPFNKLPSAGGVPTPGFITVGGKGSDDPTTGATLLAPVVAAATANPTSGANNVAASAGDPAWAGRFRTPTLRNVAVTAPYKHNGAKDTLADVINFYNGDDNPNGMTAGDDGGYAGTQDPLMVKLSLTDQDKANIVEFLKALTMDPVDAALMTDTSVATPAGAAYCQ